MLSRPRFLLCTLVLLMLAGCAHAPPPVQAQTLTYTLMQCQVTPWQAAYREGAFAFPAKPTEKEVALAYFSTQLHVNVINFTRDDVRIIACQACNICPTGTSYAVAVLPRDAQTLVDHGWKNLT